MKPRAEDVFSYNSEAWNREVQGGQSRWTQPVSAETIARARSGDFSILLTEQKPAPMDWFPTLRGADVLCLACGGGQQGPVLAAAGANVTVLDASPLQLEQDRLTAAREGLSLRLILGDAAHLDGLSDGSFDLIFNPVSTVFMPQVRPVWREAFRVLRPGGVLLTGCMNPVHYIFDLFAQDEGRLEVRHRIPYSDLESLAEDDLQDYLEQGLPLEFGHSLTDLLGGLTETGFHLTGFYEDEMVDSPLAKFHPNYLALRALKPAA